MRPENIKSFRKSFKRARLNTSKIGPYIAGGADGDIYEYGQFKILKVSKGLRIKAKHVFSRMRYLTRPRRCVVKIHKWDKFHDGFEEGYWLLMERLKPISNNMEEFFTDFRDNEFLESYLKSNISNLEQFFCSRECITNGTDIIDQWREFQPKEQKQIKQFLYLLRKMKWWHDDLHGENVMQDKNGNLKMIDIESIMPRFKHYDYWSY